MSTPDFGNIVYLNNDIFNSNVEQIDETSQVMEIDLTSGMFRENIALGTESMKYLSDKIHFLADVTNAYKDFILDDVSNALRETQKNTNKAAEVAANNVTSGNKGE